MSLKLMYITNKPEVARIAENAGVDRIFVDMEYIGKSSRQRARDSVCSHHTIEDISNIRKVVTKSDLLVRINPIHEASADCISSSEEIDEAINRGADILMLPYFHRLEEIHYFIDKVVGRAKTILLLETADAVDQMDDIISLDGIDEIHIGLNDLCIDYGKTFLFELLADGTVEKICSRIKEHNRWKKNPLAYGFGGIAAVGEGLLPAEYIIKDHYRLGSSMAILSRAFCDSSKIEDIKQIQEIFDYGVPGIRLLEKECMLHHDDPEYFLENHRNLKKRVGRILQEMS